MTISTEVPKPGRRFFGRVRRHPWRTFFVVLILLILAVNVVAFVQAWAMTHFVAGGSKTGSPEKLNRLQKWGSC